MAEITWDNLTETQKQSLVKQMMIGVRKTPENQNRAKEALAMNPFLVEKYYKELHEEPMDERVNEDNIYPEEVFEDEGGLGIRKDAEAEIGDG